MTTERSVELPWLLEQAIVFPALDVGDAESTYISDLRGPVDGIDVRPIAPAQIRKHFTDDIRTWVAPEKYPTVIAVSTLEHVGLAFEPYGTAADDPDGDRHALEGCMRNLSPGGTLYLTVPYGQTHEDCGWYRRYDAASLKTLLDGFDADIETILNPVWEVGGVALVKVRHALT